MIRTVLEKLKMHYSSLVNFNFIAANLSSAVEVFRGTQFFDQ